MMTSTVLLMCFIIVRLYLLSGIRCVFVCISCFSKFNRVLLRSLDLRPFGFLGRKRSDIESVLELLECIFLLKVCICFGIGNYFLLGTTSAGLSQRL